MGEVFIAFLVGGGHNRGMLELRKWHPHTCAHGLYEQLLFYSYPLFFSKTPGPREKTIFDISVGN